MIQRAEAEAARLAEEHVGLVFHWAAVYKRRNLYREIDVNELIQEGYFGLVKAARKYDSRKGEFSTYATKWIWKFFRQFRLRSRKTRRVSCDSRQIDNLGVADAEAAYSMTDGSALDAAIDSEVASAVVAAVATLDARARDIITARFGITGERETYRTIAGRYGISGARVQQIERDSLVKMRKSKFLTHLNA